MLGRRALLLGASAGALAGCADVNQVSTREEFSNSSRDAVFMMRVRTPNDRDVGFAIPPFDRATGRSTLFAVQHEYMISPTCTEEATKTASGCQPWYSAYIVSRVPPGDYHIRGVDQRRGVVVSLGSIDPYAQAFPKRFAFTVVPGRVSYLGDFLVRFESHGFVFVNAETGIERARAYLQARYPRFTADVIANYPKPRTGPA